MSCILDILGEELDVDSVIEQHDLKPDKVSRKGELISPNWGKHKRSIIGFITSEFDGNHFKEQMEETIEYLRKHACKLEFIKHEPAVQDAALRFSIQDDNRWAQTIYFPLELIDICSKIGLKIEVTVYSI